MIRHPQDKRKLMPRTLSTWSLSLLMVGMGCGQLTAADVPLPVKVDVEKALTSVEFDAMDEINQGKRCDPVMVKGKGGDWTFTVIRDHRESISDMTWLSMDLIVLESPDSEFIIENMCNIKKHKFNIIFTDIEQEKDSKKHDHEAVRDFFDRRVPDSDDGFMPDFISHFLDLTIDFKGGSEAQILTETARVIEDAYIRQMPSLMKDFLPDRLKIEVKENDGKPRLSSLIVTNVTLSEILLCNSFFPKGDRFSKLFTCSFRPQFHALDKVKMNVCSLELDIRSPDVVTTFFNVGDLPRMSSAESNISVPNVAALFELAWTMDSNVVWAKIKFHPETGMLIVKGTKSEIEIAKTAFNTLRGISTAPNPLDQISSKLDKLIEIQSEIQSFNGPKGAGKDDKVGKEK